MDFFSFLPPFAGVLLAFVIGWIYSAYQNHRRKINVLRGVRKELESARKRLADKRAHRIEREALYEWISSVNSGTVLLLDNDSRTKIGNLYFAIDNYNYEAEILRRVYTKYREAKGTPQEKVREQIYTESNQQVFTMENDIVNAIDALLKEGFWP
jgi:homoserine trans-succinylase